MLEQVLRLPTHGVEGQRHANGRTSRGHDGVVAGLNQAAVVGFQSDRAGDCQGTAGNAGACAAQHHVVGNQPIDSNRGFESVGDFTDGLVGHAGVILRERLRQALELGRQGGQAEGLHVQVAAKVKVHTIQTRVDLAAHLVTRGHAAGRGTATTTDLERHFRLDGRGIHCHHLQIGTHLQTELFGRLDRQGLGQLWRGHCAHPGQTACTDLAHGDDEAGRCRGQRRGVGTHHSRLDQTGVLAGAWIARQPGQHMGLSQHQQIAVDHTSHCLVGVFAAGGAAQQKSLQAVLQQTGRIPAHAVESHRNACSQAGAGHHRPVKCADLDQVIGRHRQITFHVESATSDLGTHLVKHQVGGNE